MPGNSLLYCQTLRYKYFTTGWPPRESSSARYHVTFLYLPFCTDNYQKGVPVREPNTFDHLTPVSGYAGGVVTTRRYHVTFLKSVCSLSAFPYTNSNKVFVARFSSGLSSPRHQMSAGAFTVPLAFGMPVAVLGLLSSVRCDVAPGLHRASARGHGRAALSAFAGLVPSSGSRAARGARVEEDDEHDRVRAGPAHWPRHFSGGFSMCARPLPTCCSRPRAASKRS